MNECQVMTKIMTRKITRMLKFNLEEVKKKFLAAGPIAAKEAKKLVRNVMGNLKNSEDYTCNMITERRVSAEGQEGMRALLEKDKPAWMKK